MRRARGIWLLGALGSCSALVLAPACGSDESAGGAAGSGALPGGAGGATSGSGGEPVAGAGGAVDPGRDPLGVQEAQFERGGSTISFEVLTDTLLHFEVASVASGGGIPTTPMVDDAAAFAGPTAFGSDGASLETAAVRATIDDARPCFTLTEIPTGRDLTHACAEGPVVTFGRQDTNSVYGLGEQFIDPGVSDGDWTGRMRTPGTVFGNQMVSFDGGFVGNLQIPVMAALEPGGTGYGLFLDENRALTWDFTGDPFVAQAQTDAWRGYVFAGDSPLEIRQQYLEIVGRPRVPPRRAFGLWVSEYGYDGWAELQGKLDTLRAGSFPVDGFVLDLQWFGGVTWDSDDSAMGSLAWDTLAFPDPPARIAELQNVHGVQLMAIEESYVSRGLPEHADLEARGYLARAGCADCPPSYITDNPWWGKGGMIDWSHTEGADYWHDTKRQALIDDGIVGHWTDLGEPEMFDSNGWYHGVAPGAHTHADVHNLFNLLWSESIARGYERNRVTRRPFSMSRSGTAGSQRHGVAIWSADIASTLSSLAAHLNVQMHMSMSGIDYFGSDVGGFHRAALRGDLDEMYTQWFAASAMIDVPLRPHTMNTENRYETAPDRIGDAASNLSNLRLRYQLVPYLYSLAHRAYLAGEPVFPPLAFYFPADPVARTIGDTKLIGRDLLVGITAAHGETERDVYLPAGRWCSWHDQIEIDSAGEWQAAVPLYRAGVYALPLYVREGAILPLMHIDEQSMNTTGRRLDGSRRDELIIRVFPSATASSFTLYEDDGETVAYRSGEVRTTRIRQVREGDAVRVTIEAADGTYAGAIADREHVIELLIPSETVQSATLDGADLAVAQEGALARIGLGTLPVSRQKLVEVSLAP